ncbi:immunoglobulin-like domain-containing protein [Oceanirhabdus seepicola]|uniref:Endonuclease n=1 Tax=Oceanirhabdus seepicola TaxID=2828781 RepID=A0A9J6NZW6_9CLOT|nr:immunoglobulin-like domain-containing protein [Oceanirhabdus seepicola]MCM1989819.1 endonuclease [Oceanirhabdus seepicola]
MKNKFLKRISSFVAAAMIFSNLTFIGGIQNVKADEVSKLVISQYIETSSGTYPKGIELWNVSGSDIDFSTTNLSVLKGGNGGAPSSVFTLNAGKLASGEVMVIGTRDMGTYLDENGLSSVLYEEKTFQFNGDDSLQIELNGEIVDTFGTPGEDPGKAWSGNGVETKNTNIQLKSGITTGADSFGWTDPSIRFEKVADGTDLTGFGIAPVTSNQAPTVAQTITDQIATEGEGEITIDVSGTFIDADGDTLTLNVESDKEEIVTVSVNGTEVVVTPVSEGSAVITVTADDNKGGTVSTAFNVTVNPEVIKNQSPTVAQTITDQIATEGDEEITIDVSGTFSDADGDTLTISAVSDNEEVTTVVVNGTDVIVTPVSEGTTNITVTANDNKGGTVNTTFNVTVNAAQAADYLTVEQALSEAQGTEVTIQGYLVDGFNTQYGIKVADINDAQVETYIAVKLNSGDREQFNPQKNPDAQGEKVRVTGIRDSYCGEEGIVSVSSIEFIDDGSGSLSDEEAVVGAKAALTLGNTTSVTTDLNLPTTGLNETTISWESSNTAFVANDGAVTRPANGEGDATLTLTATITKGSESDTKDFTVTVLEEGATPQNNTIAAAREKNGEIVTVEGIATYCYTDGKKVYFQDETAGIFIYDSAGGLTVTEGDKVQVTGTVTSHFDVLEIVPSSTEDVKIISSENSVTPEVVTIDGIVESKESMLVKLENLTITTIDTSADTVFVDSQGRTITAFKARINSSIVEGNIVDVIAIVDQFKGNYQLKIRSESDVTATTVIMTDEEAVAGAKAALTLGNTTSVITDLNLPTTGLNETIISWESSNTAVVTNDGIVTRPENGNIEVTLTATITKGNANDTKEFIITVLEEGADPYETYYTDAYGKTGEALKAALNDIIDNNNTTLSYAQAYDALVETDEDPNKPGNVILLYTGRSVNGPAKYADGAGWNREHVWAKSHGDFGTSKGPGTDIHQLRPTDVSVNSSRGHLDFDNGGKPHSEATECNYDSDSWEPRDEVKGDVARIIFYMAVRYEGEHGEKDLELADRVNTYPNPEHGKLSVLLEWNKQDPISEFEMTRNNIIYEKYQHNRNPFIDHPEWADEIWGEPSNITDEEAVIAAKNALTLGNTTEVTSNLNLSTIGSYDTIISWDSSNKAVIANDGTVTRPINGEGNIRVTLKATITKGNANDTKDFTVTVLEEGATPQNNTIVAAREKVGEIVTVEGIATYCYTDGKKVYFQDETAGIFIYDENGGLNVEEGDKVQVTGTVTAHFDVLEIVPSGIEDVKIINSGNTVTPEVVTIDQIVESKESMLVKLENLTMTTLNTSGNTVFEDSQGRTITAFKPRINSSIVEGNIVDVIAVVDQFKGTYQLKIRNESDVIKVGDGDGGHPQPGEITKISEIQGKAHISPLVGDKVKIKGIVTSVVNGQYDKGFYIQEVIADDNDNTSEGIYVDYSGITSIGIKAGDLVTVNGKVYEEKLYPFDNQLSITYIKNASVEIESTGNALPEPIIIGDNGIMPPKEIIENDSFSKFQPQEDAIDFYESLEGMLIQIDNAVVVASTDKYGQIVVMPENGKDAVNERTIHGGIMITAEKTNPNTIMIDDVIIENEPSVNVGDKFNDSVVGVMSYGFGMYKVYNTQVLPSVTSAGLQRETTSIEFDEDKLTVASYNIENFSALTDTVKVNKIANSIVNNLNNPDIIGLIEVQDNNGDKDDSITDASKSYQTLIDAISSKGGPLYAYTDIAPVDDQDGGIPGGNIRVGYIYRTERVSLKEGTSGDATTAVGVTNQGNLTHNPGKIVPNDAAFESSRKALAAEFDFKGNEVIVIANHFCSKRGDNGLFGDVQPPVRGSEVQRHAQAQIVNDFVDSVLAKNSDANVVVLGDLNDFEFSETVNILKGGVMHNMIDSLPKNERFTYVYSGNSQVLDNILVTNNLKDTTEIDVVHINAEFTEEQGRASDHDPVLAQIAFDSDTTIPEKDIEIKDVIIMDINGNVLTEIKQGATVVVKANIKNSTEDSANGTVIVKLTDSKNKVIGIGFIKDTELKKQIMNEYAIGFTLDNETLGNCKAQVYVWDGWDTMNPLSEAVTIDFVINY